MTRKNQRTIRLHLKALKAQYKWGIRTNHTRQLGYIRRQAKVHADLLNELRAANA